MMPSPPGTPIPLGNPMEWTVTFADANNAPFDPNSSIQITIKSPTGITTVYAYPAQLTRNSIGVYSITVIGNERGSWLGTGSGLLPDGSPVTTTQIEQRVI
jgi:hypothetical protein